MKKTILVTGSSGHSGTQISELLKDTYEIVGVDLIEGKFTQHIGSLTDKTFIHALTKDVDAIIHTASLHAPHVGEFTRKDFIDTNIIGTLNLLEASVDNQVKKFIYTSTTSLYGESMESEDQAVWVTEELPTIPRDIYDITKIAAEGLCRDFFEKNGLQTTVLRVSRFWNEPLHDRIFYRMYRGLDVRDVAYANQLAIEKQFDKFDVFNISSQSIFTKDDLVDLRQNAIGLIQERVPELLTFFGSKNWTVPESIDRVYVIDKAKKEIGFHPRFNIKEMLAEL